MKARFSFQIDFAARFSFQIDFAARKPRLEQPRKEPGNIGNRWILRASTQVRRWFAPIAAKEIWNVKNRKRNF
ncbi:hypothetical protein BGS_1108 [Beggiatoa sp. SS]|nr:hypothetical protein BGS_1108 [Beggiatoa sp. SS]